MDFTTPFSEFWLRYLEAHRKPGTRAARYAATAVGVLSTATVIHQGEPLLMLGGIALSYVIAAASHWTFERNRPLIRVNAVYGAVADLKMCWLALTGRLAGEYDRLGLEPRSDSTGSQSECGPITPLAPTLISRFAARRQPDLAVPTARLTILHSSPAGASRNDR